MSVSEDNLHVVFTIDENFYQHCCVCLASLFFNNRDLKFTVHLITNSKKKSGQKKIERFIKSNGHSLQKYLIDERLTQSFRISHHVTNSTYYRLFVSQYLQSINKVLYLDADILVLRSILNLWNTDIKEKVAGVVYPPSELDFNAGVMLLNLNNWRKGKVTERCVDWLTLNHDRIQFWDQDALNAVLQSSDLLQLESVWNTVTPNDAINNPNCICHFVGQHKPWNFYCEHPLRHKYYEYLRLTPWKGYRPQQERLWSRLKFKIKQIIGYD